MNPSTTPETANSESTGTIFSSDEFSLQGYDKHIRQARNAIFAVAVLLTINLLMLVGSAPQGYEYLWMDIALWSVFIAGFIFLGFWTKKKPYYAIVGALCLYALFMMLNAALDISTLFKGILFKIIIVVLLVKGINDAKEAQELQKNFGR
jgi:prepilin signal peptidase PulO-like enzyme (type II secretory pathway)